ncbi:MAG: DUF928 domain-containing protein [Cyanobacteria bacterium P01_F01_bin.86]
MKVVPLLKYNAIKLLSLFLILGTSSAAFAVPYVPPAGLGAPARRESAGTRGCVFGNPSTLVALMPTNNVGWTTESHPRFYWYMPVNQASFVEFTLEKTAEGTETPEVIYQTRLEVTGENGIMSLQLPETEGGPSLAEGDRYRWQVAIFCNPNSPQGEIKVDGWVERQIPDGPSLAELATASDIDQVDWYASNGYWFDALDRLAMLKTKAPEDSELQVRWEEFLTSVDLDAMVCQPFQ